jgi:hypothetical protein
MTKLNLSTRILVMTATALLGLFLPSRHAWAQG